MAQMTITDEDIAALASKLDAMADRFDEHERAALHAVFHLAGSAMCDAAVEVAGYAAPVSRSAAAFAVRADPTQDALGSSFDAGLLHGPPEATAAPGLLTIELSR